MKAESFCYWLQGYFELSSEDLIKGLSLEQVDTIKRHLATVFIHDIDPSFPQEQQQALEETHQKESTPDGSSGATVWPPKPPDWLVPSKTPAYGDIRFNC